jgi:sulfite exporter TauE/SafE
MSPLDLSIPFGLGLVSSLHCAQMCGPLVLAYSLPLERSGGNLARAHLAYNGGRLATYSVLGALAGMAGGGMVSLGRLAGIERTAALVAGLAMIVAAILLFWRPSQNLVQIGGTSRALPVRLVAKLLRSGTAGSKLLLGASMGFLPCGLIYAALLKAVESGSAVSGALTMFAFGAGTAGALLGIGFFSTAITARLGRHANTLAALSVLFVGGFLLWRGFHVPPVAGGSCHHG